MEHGRYMGRTFFPEGGGLVGDHAGEGERVGMGQAPGVLVWRARYAAASALRATSSFERMLET